MPIPPAKSGRSVLMVFIGALIAAWILGLCANMVLGP